MIMIRCPKTGQAISTGRYVEPATFRSTPVFFSRTYCPLCRSMHEWFAKDAWVSETAGSKCVPHVSRKLRSATIYRNFSQSRLYWPVFMMAGAAPARVRTIHYRVPHDPRPLHMQEGRHCTYKRAPAIRPGRTTGAPYQSALLDGQ